MPKTELQRVYPETVKAVENAALPAGLDTFARRLAYLVEQGVKVVNVAVLDPVNPKGADVSEAEPVVYLDVAAKKPGVK